MDREDIVTHLPTAHLMQATKLMGNCTDCNYRKHHMHLFSSHSFTKTQNENAQNACLMQATQFMGNCNDCNYRKHHMHLFSSHSFTKTQNENAQNACLMQATQFMGNCNDCNYRKHHMHLFQVFHSQRHKMIVLFHNRVGSSLVDSY